MKIEEEIQQRKFRSVYHKTAINLLFTSLRMGEVHAQFFKKYDLTIQQFSVLRILRVQYPTPLSARSIKEKMLDRQSDISRLLERLLKKNWVEKKPSLIDRRAFDVMLTESALHLLDSIDPKMHEMDAAISRLSEAECDTLNELLDRSRG